MERTERLNELIKRELGSVIAREFDVAPTTFITITEVSVSQGIETAAVSVSIYPDAMRKTTFKELANRAGELQGFLNKRLDMRPIPKIAFILDLRTKEAAHIEELLDEIEENEDNQERGLVAPKADASRRYGAGKQ